MRYLNFFVCLSSFKLWGVFLARIFFLFFVHKLLHKKLGKKWSPMIEKGKVKSWALIETRLPTNHAVLGLCCFILTWLIFIVIFFYLAAR